MQGVCRTVQGPALIDLQTQTQLSAADFQIIFTLCTFSFPLGNLLGSYYLNFCDGCISDFNRLLDYCFWAIGFGAALRRSPISNGLLGRMSMK